MASALDRPGEGALVLGAVTRLTAGPDLATVRDKALDYVELLVVDRGLFETHALRSTNRRSTAPAPSAIAATLSAVRRAGPGTRFAAAAAGTLPFGSFF